ncbi:hypothetical protein [Sulfitobacter sp.]|uniref:hypothetical protein n=1 Tax=Sulfitobacter sp. TaxID=1903071 RepID=UPI003EF19FA2
MKLKTSAAQLEARQKAGLSTSDPTHACSGAIPNAKPDCEEKRDPDKQPLIIQKKENEPDPDTRLEERPFAAMLHGGPLCGRSHLLATQRMLMQPLFSLAAKGALQFEDCPIRVLQIWSDSSNPYRHFAAINSSSKDTEEAWISCLCTNCRFDTFQLNCSMHAEYTP